MNVGVGLIISGIIVFLLIAVIIFISNVIEKIIYRISPKYKTHYDNLLIEYKERQKEFKA